MENDDDLMAELGDILAEDDDDDDLLAEIAVSCTRLGLLMDIAVKIQI